MFLAHSIRLRDPWQCEPTAEGGTRWVRRFHRPTGLEPDDQLLLVLSGLPADAVVMVNGQSFVAQGGRDPLATGNGCDLESPPVAKGSRPLAARPAQFDLTAILANSNEIKIEVSPVTSDLPSPTSSRFPYDARLAIIGHS